MTELPRERMYRRGAGSLGDEELLTILVGTGVRDAPARKVASTIVDAVGGIVDVSRASPRELAQITGIGSARAARIAAAFELGRRVVEAEQHRPTLARAEDVFRIVSPRVLGLHQEVFFAIGLDVRNRVLDVIEVARGTVNGVNVHPREVFRPLVRMSALGAVLVHNHPSGDPTPSPDDIALTRRMRAVGEVVGIPVIDHVVVGERTFRSIAEWMGSEL
jgi:DNA repair protein RadC